MFTSEQDMIETVRQETPLGKSHYQSLLFGLKCYIGRRTQPGNRFNYAKGDHNMFRDSVQSLNMTKLETWMWQMHGILWRRRFCLLWRYVFLRWRLVSLCRPQWMNSDVTAKTQKKKHANQKLMQSRDGKDYLLYTSLGTRPRVLVGPPLGTWKRILLRTQRKTLRPFCLRQDKKLEHKMQWRVKFGERKVSSDKGKANVLNCFLVVFSQMRTSVTYQSVR